MNQLLFSKLASESACVPSRILRIAFPFSLEEFFASNPRRVVAVPDFVPPDGAVEEVRIESTLCDDAFRSRSGAHSWCAVR